MTRRNRVSDGLDFDDHSVFTAGSPSVQIDMRTVRKAVEDGLAFDRKGNAETAVPVRPDQFMGYVYNAGEIHRYGRNPKMARLFSKASSREEIDTREIRGLAEPRKRIVETVSRLSRAGCFREQVLRAYKHMCAVTGMQLRLVDAAHILPVGAPGSPDDVRNGIALSPTYHRAFDQGLIFVDDSLTMKISPGKEEALLQRRLDGGLAGSRAPLGRLMLPPDRRQWPDVQLIRKANRYRGIKSG